MISVRPDFSHSLGYCFFYCKLFGARAFDQTSAYPKSMGASQAKYVDAFLPHKSLCQIIKIEARAAHHYDDCMVKSPFHAPGHGFVSYAENPGMTSIDSRRC